MNLILDITKAEIKTIGGFITVSIPQEYISKRNEDVRHIIEFLANSVPYPILKLAIEDYMDCKLTLNPETQDLDGVPPVPYAATSKILTQEEIDKMTDKLIEDLEEKHRERLANREINGKDGDLML